MTDKNLRREYVLNGHHYYQTELVWIQFRGVMDILKPMYGVIQKVFETGGKQDNPAIRLPNPDEVVNFLGTDLLNAVALLLIPEGGSVKDRDEDQIVADLEVTPVSKIEELLIDFFTLNDVPSHLKRTSQMIRGMSAGDGENSKKSTGKNSKQPSARETSPSETTSGTKSDSQQPSAS